MTFTRVHPVPGWQINEKVTSTQLNQLDADHAEAVDGTNGGTYPGVITWNGLQTMDNVVMNGLVFCNDLLEINGNFLMNGSGSSTATWITGTSLITDSGSTVTIGSTQAATTFANGFTINGTGINFGATVANPTITQSNGSTTGQNIVLHAQSVSGAHTPGNIVLAPGNGNLYSYGQVTLCPFTGTGTTNGALQVIQCSLEGGLTPNTQTLSNFITQAFTSTTTGGGAVPFYILPMQSSTAAFVEITWMRRNTGGTAAFGNRGCFSVNCNSGGTTSGGASAAVAYSTLDTQTSITGYYSVANEVAFFVTNTVASVDYQFKIEVVYI